MRDSLVIQIENVMLKAAALAAPLGYPTSWETLEIDENRSLWASYMPDYQPRPALQKDISADLAIIGGGFTGISTAQHFSERFPNRRVVVLEAKTLANGASGRNGGMMLNWVYGTGAMSPETTARVYHATRSTIDHIQHTIESHPLDVSYRRDGCLEVFTNPERAAEAEQEIAKLNSIGIPIQFLSATAARQRVNLQGIYGALYDPSEGQLNGLQYVRELGRILQARGVEIYEQTPVLKVEEGATITLTTPHGKVRAKAIVLALNGYTGKLGYFRKAYFPLHSHVFATAPIAPDQLHALGWSDSAGFADDLNRISYATTTREGHLVFGGGSNRSYDYRFNNRTAWHGNIEPAIRAMSKTLHNYLPGTAQIPIAHRWSGTLAISFRRNCSMGVRGDHKNVYYALGYSGHGVTAANLAGRVLTDLYAGDVETWRGLPFLQAEFARIPLEPFRWIGYHFMTRLTGRSPRMPHR
jgi:glycine/D-amino acid oxidase-like deaminating enzyme